MKIPHHMATQEKKPSKKNGRTDSKNFMLIYEEEMKQPMPVTEQVTLDNQRDFELDP